MVSGAPDGVASGRGVCGSGVMGCKVVWGVWARYGDLGSEEGVDVKSGGCVRMWGYRVGRCERVGERNIRVCCAGLSRTYFLIIYR